MVINKIMRQVFFIFQTPAKIHLMFHEKDILRHFHAFFRQFGEQNPLFLNHSLIISKFT